MNSLKQVIVSAVIKVSTDPLYANREYATSQDARADFIKALIAELFPECPDCVLPSAVHASEVVVVEVPVVEEKKKRAPKKKEEAAPVVVEEADGGGVPAVEVAKEKKKRAPKKKEEAAPVEETKEETVPVAEEKKKRAPKKKEEAPAAAPAEEKKEETVPVVEEKKKRGPKPKVVEGAVNHPKKLNKTEENKVKSISKELKVEVEDTKVLEYLNGLTAEEYAAKSFDEHVRALLTPTVAVVEEKVAKRGLLVEFEGKDYWIDPETKKVYATTGSVDEHVGHVGMLEFAKMEIPEYLPEDLEEIV